MKYFKSFALMVGAAVVSSLLGGLFCGVISVFPELLAKGLPTNSPALVQVSSGLGIIIGFFLGAGGTATCLFLSWLDSRKNNVSNKLSGE